LDLDLIESHLRTRFPQARIRRRRGAATQVEYVRFDTEIAGLRRQGMCFDRGGIVVSDGSPEDWADTLSWYLPLLPSDAPVVAMTEHNQDLTPIPSDATPTQIQQVFEQMMV
jgi:hypothetical protein